MAGRAAFRTSLAVAVAVAAPAGAGAQVFTAPENNFHAAANGMMSLCPSLVDGGAVPDEKASAAFGLKPMTSPPGQHRFESLFDEGTLQLWFEPSQRRCMIHYSGAGFRAIAGLARDLAKENGFKPFKIDSPNAPKGDVFIRSLAGGGRQNFIVVETADSQTVSVSLSQKVGW